MSPNPPRLSVLVTTRNEAAHISACLAPFAPYHADGSIELIVIDNASTDDTPTLATRAGARVYQQGPERSAQRNRGAREAHAPFLLFLDADMIVPDPTIQEILSRIASPNTDALYIREVRTGSGLRTRARNFERSFYDATCIDSVRLIRTSLFLQSGGFDESLTGVEDWDLDRRIATLTPNIHLTNGHLLHNEQQLSLKRVLQKKAYYSQSFALYQQKWHHDTITRKQFSPTYRFFGVFTEHGKWKRILHHPILFTTLILERILVGCVYLLHK